MIELVRSILLGGDTLEVFGPTGSCKTTFALLLAADVVKKGGKVYYVDSERNVPMKPSYNNIIYRYTPSIDEMITAVKNAPSADLLILDSLGIPVLGVYASASMHDRGTMLLKSISVVYHLKNWAKKSDGIALVINQPRSAFGENVSEDELPPFSEKAQFEFKEIWRSDRVVKSSDKTVCRITSWRSRLYGFGTTLFEVTVGKDGIKAEPKVTEDDVKSRVGLWSSIFG